MVKKIMVARKETALYVASKLKVKGLAVISISSYKKDIIFTEAVQKQLNCYDVLNFVFADLTENDFKISPKLVSEFPHFTVEMAREIVHFLNKLKDMDINLLFIHCDAGISRSGAVGVFACRYLGMDETEFRKEHKNIGPNTLVYDTLCQVSGLRGDYQAWWENTDPVDPRILFT